MTQFYSDPSRESESTSLPDAEVFYMSEGESVDEENQPLPEGWFYWFCFPGCLPDSGIFGPFDTQAEAIMDARGGNFDC